MKLPFFKAAWEHKNPQKRLAAVSRLNPQQAQQLAVLKQLCQSDSETAVREAAMARIGDSSWLLENLQLPGAQTRLIEQLTGQNADLADCLKIVEKLPPALLCQVCAAAARVEIRTHTLDRVRESDSLVEIACRSDFAETRRAAADRLQDEASLQQVWQTARERDKQLARDLRQRLDQLKAEREAEKAAAASAAELSAAMQQLADEPWSPHYRARFTALVSKWQELERDHPDLPADEYRRHAIKAEAVVTAHRQVEDSMRRRTDICKAIPELESQWLALDDIPSQLQRVLDNWAVLRRDWVDCDTHSPAEPGQQTAFDGLAELVARLQNWCQDLVPQLSQLEQRWDQLKQQESSTLGQLEQLLSEFDELDRQLAGLAGDPPVVEIASAKQRAATQSDELRARIGALREKAGAAEKLIGSTRKAIRAGNLQKATAMRRKLEARLEQLDPDLRQSLSERLEKLDQELASLQDWKAFATLPKFEQYCEAMEKLASEPLAPPQQVEQVKALQEAWKELHMSAPEEIWQRFQDAGHQAWKPCAEWFDEQESARQQNQQQREKLLDELQQLAQTMEGDVDWQQLRKTFRSLESRWRACGAAPRGAQGRLQKTFAKQAKKIRQGLETEYQKNLLLKQRLLEQARALAAEPEKNGVLEQMKQLQLQWRQAGIVDPREERKLWKQFQAAGDALFGAEKQRIERQKSERKQQLDELSARLAETRQQWQKGELDGQQWQDLQRDLQQLESAPRHEREVQQLLRQRRDFEKAMADGRRREQQEQLQQSWQAIVEVALGRRDAAELPADLAADMASRQREQMSAQESSELLRELRIQMQLLLGLESPAEDAQLRMQLQMKQLQEGGVGQSASVDPQLRVRQLLERWLSLAGQGEQQAREELAELFLAAGRRGIAAHV